MPEDPRRTVDLSTVVSERVKQYRQKKKWSQGRLIEEMGKLGYKTDRSTLTRLEGNQSRAEHVPLREILVLAAVLDVPPVLLFVPLGEDVELQLTPELRMDPHSAYEWIAGAAPLAVVDEDGEGAHARNPGKWTENSEVMVLNHFGELRRLQDEVQTASQELSAKEQGARRKGSVPELEAKRDRALAVLVQHRRTMRMTRLVPPPMPREWAERARQLNFDERVR
jgi:transcriptional regulator with XRE-family HTH domain